MNILFFVNTIDVGGGEIWLVDAIQALQKRGHSVWLGCPSNSWIKKKAEAEKLPFFDFLSDPVYEGHLYWQLVSCLKTQSIDLVICCIPCGLRDIELIGTAIREVGKGRLFLRLGVVPGSKTLNIKTLSSVQDILGGIFVVSEHLKQYLSQHLPNLNTPVSVVYNGVNLSLYDTKKFSDRDIQDVRHPLKIPCDHIVIGTLSRLDLGKNISLAIRAFANIHSEFNKTHLAISGEGHQKNTLKKMITDLKLSHAVTFVGQVTNVPRFLYSIDMLAHTSLSEGLPNALLEGMAMSKPVVSTDVGGISELIENNLSGILVPSENLEALTQAFKDLLIAPFKRKKLGENARNRVEERFDRKHKISELEALLQQALLRNQNAISPNPTQPPRYDLPPNLFPDARSCPIG